METVNPHGEDQTTPDLSVMDTGTLEPPEEKDGDVVGEVEANRPRVHITIERDTVVLVLQATESAAIDATEALRLAETALKEAQAAVQRAQVDSDSAVARATFVRGKVERAIGESED